MLLVTVFSVAEGISALTGLVSCRNIAGVLLYALIRYDKDCGSLLWYRRSATGFCKSAS